MSELKRTPLYDEHILRGGKLVEYAGWEMPVEYEGLGLVAEHTAVREKVGIFDVSHMGEIKITGEDAEKFVDMLVTNDIKVLENNQVAYTLMCNEEGGVVDDLLVYKYSKEEILLVVNAANIEKDVSWIRRYPRGFNVTIQDASPVIAQVAIQGPNAQKVLQKIVDVDLNTIGFFYFNESLDIVGEKCIVSRTGYTGEDGFEIYTSNEHVVAVWNAIIKAGKEEGIVTAGLGARDTLRFEAALPLYGNEISDTISPIEAGLSYFVKLDKEKFIGKKALDDQKKFGAKRKIVGFEMIDKGIPRHGYEVLKDGEVIGEVTTGYFSPTLQKTIGNALIKVEYGNLDDEIVVRIRDKEYKVKVINRNFYKKNTKTN